MRTKLSVYTLFVALFISCAHPHPPTAILGVYDPFCDREEWQFLRKSAGVDLFVHSSVQNCTIYSDSISEIFEEEAEKGQVRFGTKNYYVTKGFVNNKLSSVYYCDENLDCLHVGLEKCDNQGACIQAVEKILKKYAAE